MMSCVLRNDVLCATLELTTAQRHTIHPPFQRQLALLSPTPWLIRNRIISPAMTGCACQSHIELDHVPKRVYISHDETLFVTPLNWS